MWNHASAAVIARWEVEPLVRSRRGFDERLVLAAPWLMRALVALVVHARPGSRLRRVVLSHAVRVGFAANHRRDYRAMCALLSPEIELHIYPDVPQLRALDIEPIYHGREGYVKATNLIKAEFENFRWELRELIDPGGTCFGARADIVAHGGLSGVEVRRTDFIVWQVEHGLARRQWELGSEAAMLTMLDRAQTRSS